MLNIFGRQRQPKPAAGDSAQEESLRSHVLPRFVKRIRAAERPTVLDLGRLSGGNIEFFGRVGCRLQIEDLLSCLEEAPPRTALDTVSAGPATGDARTESIPPLRPAPAALPLIRETASPPPPDGGRNGAAGNDAGPPGAPPETSHRSPPAHFSPGRQSGARS